MLKLYFYYSLCSAFYFNNQIVKFIVQVKQAEAAERLAAKDKKERNQKIMRVIERKQNEALEGKSLEELTAMLEE